MKGKVGDLGDSSESVRSAKKSLRFAAETNRSPPKTHPRSPPNSEERKKKSWYEMTLEEEEEVSKQATDDKDKPYSGDPELNEVDDPNA